MTHQMLQQGVAQDLKLHRLVKLEQLGGNRRAGMHFARLELQGGRTGAGAAISNQVIASRPRKPAMVCRPGSPR